jgi:hypothetical protein
MLPDPASVEEQVRRDGGGVVLVHDFDRNPATAQVRSRYVLDLTTRLLQLADQEGFAVRPLGELLGESDERKP